MKPSSDSRTFNGVPLFAFLWYTLSGTVVAFFSLVTAVAPGVTIRIMPFFLLLVVILAASINRSEKKINDTFISIWLTLLISTLVLWPTYLLFKIGDLPALDARRIVVGLTLLSALYWAIATKNRFSAFSKCRHKPLLQGVLIVITYAIWRIASCFVSSAPVASLVQVGWEILYYFSLFFIAFIFFSTDKLRDKIHCLLLWLMLIVGFYTCVERILETNLIAQWAPRNEEFAATIRALSVSRIRDGQFRTQGTFEHPLLLAEFSSIVMCYALAMVLWPAEKSRNRLLGLLALIASLVTAYFSGARSALVSIGVGTVIVFSLRVMTLRPAANYHSAMIRKWLTVLALALITITAIPAVLLVTQGSNAGEAGSTLARIVMLKIGLSALEVNPLLGFGPGLGPSIAGIRTGNGLWTMDNYLLSIAIESGIPALILFSACLIYPAWAATSQLAAGAEKEAPFLAGTAGAMVAVMVMRSILWMPFNLSLVFIVSAVALAQCRRSFLRSTL